MGHYHRAPGPEGALSQSRWECIYAVVRQVPRGKVATYGQIATLAGLRGHARQVGYALHALPDGTTVPWHRVINAQGRVSPRAEPDFVIVQLKLLEAEGIEIGPGDRISLGRFGWKRSGTPLSLSFPKRRTESVGKGDKKTKRGKIWRGTFGNRRKRKKKKVARPAAS
ncbi:MAG: 30S ribosomal protein THX [Gemmatimonadetes bacterium]|nr:30S ribosomal protein THX [Gemmatimonadota bacterium]